MSDSVLSMSIGDAAGLHPGVADFFITAGVAENERTVTVADWLARWNDGRTGDLGMDSAQAGAHLLARVARAASPEPAVRVDSLTITGGVDKGGNACGLTVTVRAGDVVCVVGPTGSGKSRLLADIECLAQGDTPSGRRVLVNGTAPGEALRCASSGKLIAQLSQNMNFVMDLTVGNFVALHADCRIADAARRDAAVGAVIACANDLAGERFSPATSLTQLSGGQSRALMIADTALLSASPIVLIDEIENAGIDRRKALDLLVSKDKIVLMSTHDPILALLGSRRLVIRNGAVAGMIDTSRRERDTLRRLEALDRGMMDLRGRLRAGSRIDAPLDWLTDAL
mgnify:CR=1 FL=1